MPIGVNKKIITRIRKTQTGFDYSPVPSEEGVLKESENYLGRAPRIIHGTIRSNFGDEERAFGPLLKRKTFKKGLRKLQQKMKVGGFA